LLQLQSIHKVGCEPGVQSDPTLIKRSNFTNTPGKRYEFDGGSEVGWVLMNAMAVRTMCNAMHK
jgi:hypothetical protein